MVVETHLHEHDPVGVHFVQNGQFLVLPTTVKHMDDWLTFFTTTTYAGK